MDKGKVTRSDSSGPVQEGSLERVTLVSGLLEQNNLPHDHEFVFKVINRIPANATDQEILQVARELAEQVGGMVRPDPNQQQPMRREG